MRVVITDTAGAGCRGILAKVGRDYVALEGAEHLSIKRMPSADGPMQEHTEATPAPGLVVIPLGRIARIQVVSPDGV